MLTKELTAIFAGLMTETTIKISEATGYSWEVVQGALMKHLDCMFNLKQEFRDLLEKTAREMDGEKAKIKASRQ